MIYSVYIINKAGGLIFQSDYSAPATTEEHTFQNPPVPLVFKADSGKVEVVFGEIGTVKPGHVILSVNNKEVNTVALPDGTNVVEALKDLDYYPLTLAFGRSNLSTNEKIMLASTFHSLYAIATKIAPQEKASGIQLLETDHFNLHCFQTITGVKFIVLVDHKQTACELLLHRIYELYTDYVLKNPFYSLDMPIRCELFDKQLKRVIEQVERANVYNSGTLT